MNDYSHLPKDLIELSKSYPTYPLEKWSGAVVMLIVEDSFVLIRRSYNMPSHKGQIGFMGGHRHKNENRPSDTAAREFYEESGFTPDRIEVLGLVEPVFTVKKKLIIPVVARLNGAKAEFMENVKSNGEWQNLVLVPITYLKDSQLWTTGLSLDHHYKIYFHPLLKSKCEYYRAPKKFAYVLWGASAKMIVNFFKK